MTGICGWIDHTSPNTDPNTIASRMTSNLAGAGKDQQSASEHLCLAGRFKNASNLFTSADGPTVAIDGQPRWTDRRFASIAESEGHGRAAAAAYSEYGTDMFQALAGVFALALYDPHSHRLILAIDRMGIRPLCYSVHSGSELVFGSTTDSVLASGRVDAAISSQSIYDYFFFHVIPSPTTIYSSIAKLEPGQYIELRDNIVRKGFYWQPEPGDRSASDIRELEQQLVPCIRTSISNCSPDADTAAFLSGGLDSSTVAGVANELFSEPLRAFSIGFAQEGYDEVEYARIAADHFDLDLRTYYVTPDDVADSINPIASAYDEPFGNSSAIPTYFCAKVADADGVQLMLAGDGGDELFAGNERYATQKLFDLYTKIPRGIRGSLIEPITSNVPMGWSRITHKIKRYVEQAMVPMPERLQTYNYLHMHDPATVFHRDFLSTVDADHPFESMRDWYHRIETDDLIDKMLFFDWKLTLADNDLRKVNTMCDLVGVDVAYPMLDDELVSFSTRVPSRHKLRRRELRHFFKQSMQGVLSEKTLNKGKHGFGLPFGEWLRSSQRLQSVVSESMERLKTRDIFSEEFIQYVISMHRTDHAAFYGTVVWVLVTLDTWLHSRESRHHQ